MGITISMDRYVPPIRPQQTYSQGFWHAVIAAVLYLVSSMLLMVNMLGYFLGHYPQHFELSEEQRNLILQTMMFFIWLAGGAAIFEKTCGWAYADALYFCDVTVLTVGFGDFYAPNDVGRGLVLPFSVGGIIILGLMVSSIRKFAQELGHDKIIKRHVEKRRTLTIGRSVTTSEELERRLTLENKPTNGVRPTISAPLDPKQRSITFDVESGRDGKKSRKLKRTTTIKTGVRKLRKASSRKPKILMLREEKDRFDAMRKIQRDTHKFKRYYALTMSVIACT